MAIAAAAVCAVYASLIFPGAMGDSSRFLLRARVGESVEVGSIHFLYQPVLVAWCRALAPLGWPHYLNASLLSAVGTSVGLVAIHGGNRLLGASFARSAVIVSLIAFCPAVALFARVVEVHGVFMAGFGLALLATANWVVRPSLSAAAGCAFAMVLAYCFHNSGLLLPGIGVLVFVAHATQNPTSRGRVVVRQILVAGSIWVIGIASAPHVLSAILPGQAGSGELFELLGATMRIVVTRLHEAPSIVWSEIGLALAPISLCWIAAFAHPRLRAIATWTGLVTIGYAAVCVIVLGGFLDGEICLERGAYALPLTWPFAWLTVHVLPRLWIGLVLVVSATFAIAQIYSLDGRERIANYAAGVRQVAGDRVPYLLIEGETEREILAFDLVEVEFDYILDLVLLDLATQSSILPAWRERLAARSAAGFRLLLTAEAESMLRQDDVAALPTVPALRAFLEQHAELRPVSAEGFAGFELLLR